eukprot:g7791.t1
MLMSNQTAAGRRSPADAAEALVSLANCGIFRDGRWLVRGVDLSISRGEVVTLIGPNGAGKSTTAKMAIGVLTADEGTIVRKRDLRIGYVPQKLAIDWTMPLSVRRLMRLTSPLKDAEIVAALESTGIAHLVDAEVRHLSGGEFQRALLARAIGRKPDLMVLDEPVQGVDFAGEAALYDLIRTIRSATGCGILMISHDLHMVMAGTDTVICLNGHVCCRAITTTTRTCRTAACAIAMARSPTTAIRTMGTITSMDITHTTMAMITMARAARASGITRKEPRLMLDDFFVRALIAGIGVALTAGPLGCFVVWRRMAYFGDTMAHSALLGVALSLFFQINLLLSVFGVAVLVSLLLLVLQRRQSLSADALLGILSHSALAIGLVLVAFMTWVRIDLIAFLFGDILAVTPGDIALIWGGGALVVAALVFLWRPLIASTVSEDLAEAEGMKPAQAKLFFMLLMALVIAIAMKIVGIMLITSLLIIPAATARRFSANPEWMAVLATGQKRRASRRRRRRSRSAVFANDAPPDPVLRSECLEFAAKALPVLHVAASRVGKPRCSLVIKASDGLGGRSDNQGIVRELFAFGHQRIGTDKAVPADPCTVQDGGTHADERIVTDDAAVDDRVVTDRAIAADPCREARIRMDHDTFLDVGAGANRNRFVVATQHRTEPDADILAQFHLADDVCVRRHPVAVLPGQRRPEFSEGIDRHRLFSRLRLDDGKRKLSHALHTTGNPVATDNRADAGRGAGHDHVTRRQNKQPRQLGDDLRQLPDHLIEIAGLFAFAVHIEPDIAFLWVADRSGGNERRHRSRHLECLCHFPRTTHLLHLILEIATGKINADAIAIDLGQSLFRSDIGTARRKRHHQFHLVVDGRGQGRIGEAVTVIEIVRVLLEEEPRFARRIMPHLYGVVGIVPADAIDPSNRKLLLSYSPAEHPVALQLGGSDPGKLREALRIALDYGYDEVNLNVGCPSDRVQSGSFGACLMRDPDHVAAIVSAMKSVSAVPVTVKCRIGVDDQEPAEILPGFLTKMIAAGAEAIWIHARKAWLQGLSPKENREIPPLDYDLVYRMKHDNPDVFMGINGGITDLEQAARHLEVMDGVMLGRAAYQNAGLLAGVDALLEGRSPMDAAAFDWLALRDMMMAYAEDVIAAGGRLHHVTRHMVGLFQGFNGARRFRQILSTEATRPHADIKIIADAFAAVDIAGGIRKTNPEPGIVAALA